MPDLRYNCEGFASSVSSPVSLGEILYPTSSLLMVLNDRRGFPAVKSRKVIAQVKQRYFMDKSKPMTAAVAANEYRFLPKSLSVRGYFERITQEKEGPPPATISASTDLLAPWPQEMPPSFSEFSSTLVSHASNFSTPALERDGFDEPFSPHYPHNGYSEVFTPNQVTISTSDTLYGQHNSSRKLQKLNLMDDEIEGVCNLRLTNVFRC